MPVSVELALQKTRLGKKLGQRERYLDWVELYPFPKKIPNQRNWCMGFQCSRFTIIQVSNWLGKLVETSSGRM